VSQKKYSPFVNQNDHSLNVAIEADEAVI
jgi:hypothetical protein